MGYPPVAPMIGYTCQFQAKALGVPDRTVQPGYLAGFRPRCTIGGFGRWAKPTGSASCKKASATVGRSTTGRVRQDRGPGTLKPQGISAGVSLLRGWQGVAQEASIAGGDDHPGCHRISRLPFFQVSARYCRFMPLTAHAPGDPVQGMLRRESQPVLSFGPYTFMRSTPRESQARTRLRCQEEP